MIKITKGNILDCTEDIIVHQVNVQGYMGEGLARQLADRYSNLEKDYSICCKENNNNYQELKGLSFIKKYGDKYIANLFSQKPNFDTDYEALKTALNWVKKKMKEEKLSIAIPYGIGCGIANGDWNKVYEIIEEIYEDCDVTLYRLEE